MTFFTTNTLKTKLVLIFIILAYCSSVLNAQVTIGSGAPPSAAALLDIKTQEADSHNVTSTKGGILLPRVMLDKRTELSPFIEGVVSEGEKLLHTGLFVFNLSENEAEELKKGIYYWDGEKWISLVKEEVGKAAFALVNCEDITFEGQYKSGTPLTNGNLMKLRVNVTKPGTYTIMAKAEPHNGYYFQAEGEFKTEGVYEILAMGAGTPREPRENPNFDNIFIEFNGKKIENCSKQLEIVDSSIQPKFEITCASVKVEGVYRIKQALDATHYISIKYVAEAGTGGAPLHFYTDEVGGIKFEGKGVIAGPGEYEIKMYGSGILTDLNPKTYTIKSNSITSANVCTADIQPVVGKKKIVAFGDINYGLTSGGNDGCGAMIKDLMNYGNNANSIVKYEGFSSVTVENGYLTDAKIAQYTGENGVSEPYDIILITYNLTPNAVQRGYLTKYVNKGGVLIYLDQNSTAANAAVIGDIFGETMSTPANIGYGCNQVMKFEDVDDEILNGPFGDVRNKVWGEDFANSCGLTNLPTGAIVYVSNIDASTGQPGTGTAANVKAAMLRHPTKNFFWCGDSGLIHGGTDRNSTIVPFWVGSKTINGVVYPKYPADKPNYGYPTANRLAVSNSTLFANVMAWALKMAEENGINSGNF